MTWLFGDSSESRLEINYIEFIRLAMDFAVEVLLAEDGLAAGHERRTRVQSDADAECARLEAFGATILQTVGAQSKIDDSPTGRCASTIARATSEAVKIELAAIKDALAGELARIDAGAASERERCVKALETLLLRYDLPETLTTLQVTSAGTTSYLARLHGTTSFGLETLLDLQIPEKHPFAHDVRVERLVDGLEVKVPEVGGWLRKQSRIAPHKLGRYLVTGLSSTGPDVRIELRASRDAHAAGFDVIIDGEKLAVRLSPVGKQLDGQANPSFEPDLEDSAKLRQLSERLAGVVSELGHSRRALLDAKLDGEPLQTYGRPATLVERVVVAMTPSARAIAQHSASAGELVLRRLLGGDRREEVFVSKSELTQKLERLPAASRAIFGPLGFDPGSGGAATEPQGRTRPPPAPPSPRPGTDSVEVDVGMVIDEDSGSLRTSKPEGE